MHLGLKTGPLCHILYIKIKGVLFFNRVPDGLSQWQILQPGSSRLQFCTCRLQVIIWVADPPVSQGTWLFTPQDKMQKQFVFLRRVRERWLLMTPWYHKMSTCRPDWECKILPIATVDRTGRLYNSNFSHWYVWPRPRVAVRILARNFYFLYNIM
jgi:hypothetical protein